MPHTEKAQVKGGGHTTNPGFSSTTGVLIAMSRFSQVTYDAVSQTAVVGAGLIWDDVYAALAPYNVNVVGGRVPGIGVAGFTLGGGYSWLTNQYGLAIDNVQAFELVQPNGVIVNVTEASDPDLFFGLKGGGNNFGIVTRFTLKTYPQAQVWLVVSQLIFYDGPTQPASIFDEFLNIPSLSKDVSSRDFLSLVKAFPVPPVQRTLYRSVSLVTYTPSLLNTIINETMYWGARLAPKSAALMTYATEPFLPSILSHGAPSAYPPKRSVGLSPFNINYGWTDENSDGDFHEAAKLSAARILEAAMAEGQDVADAAWYPNYSDFDTPIVRLYGANVPTLKALKAQVDPENVMGLAGGFKI
ncbi:hypothetical protein H0H81_005751 [Sphagnurus paluster]|uniref:FAD-binding PCMH-type domain-containing protein n=1 Tax=Sphagnurus paluster TaxID=117069 RepID=A0A9P7FVM3_9AGAR|nr:hypothetical protein H0H81_005751 [Sphagnurus paluster]